ncbi:UDP-galactose transporter 1 [Tanacetum coccineum]
MFGTDFTKTHDRLLDDQYMMEDEVNNPQSVPQILPSFEVSTPPMTYPKEVEDTIGTLIEVEPLHQTKLEDVGLGDKRGLEPPIKPYSPDGFRMKVVDNLTIHTPPSPHVKLDFKFPLTVSCVHFICSSIGAYVVIKVLKVKPLISVEPEDRWRRIFPMSFVFCINIVLGNVSLRYIPVSFMQTIKSFTPATTVILQWMVWRKYFDWRIWASLVPIVGGILLTSVTELSFNMFGFCAALFGCLATSTKTILAESLLHGYKFDSINTVYYMAPFATMILAVPALLLEGAGVVQWIQTHPTPMSAIIIIIGSGVTAFCLNFSIFYVIHSTTAVTFNVAGNLKVVNIKLLWHCIAFPSIVETSPVDSRGGKRVVTSPINNELDKVLCDFKTGSINSRLKFAIGSSNEQCSNGCPLIKRINANDGCNGNDGSFIKLPLDNNPIRN